MTHPNELQDLARAILGDLITNKQRERLLSSLVMEGKEAIGRLRGVHLTRALQQEAVVTGMRCAADVPPIARYQPGLVICLYLQQLGCSRCYT